MNGTRDYWLESLDRLVFPVVNTLSNRKLLAIFPQNHTSGDIHKRQRAGLEAFSRAFLGMSSWLNLDSLSGSEEEMRERYATIIHSCIEAVVDTQSPDYADIAGLRENLVEAAFLSHALIRSKNSVWNKLEARTRVLLVDALQSTRNLHPHDNNWLLFSAMVEAALLTLTGSGDFLRIDLAVKRHLDWYKGDGVYGDGHEFHWDYYNSFVIQPMLIDIVEVMCTAESVPGHLREYYFGLRFTVLKRARRYAAILERMIAPDGSYPPVGRSLTYRCGAFHLLAQIVLRREYPEDVSPAQIRCGLTAVIRKTLDAPGTYDSDGWLSVGVAGTQPGLGESYISNGSVYLTSAIFLPLGLSSDDPFWSDMDESWTSVKIWSGIDHPADKALKDL